MEVIYGACGLLAGGTIGAAAVALVAFSKDDHLYGWKVKNFLRTCAKSEGTAGDHLEIKQGARKLLWRLFGEST